MGRRLGVPLVDAHVTMLGEGGMPEGRWVGGGRQSATAGQRQRGKKTDESAGGSRHHALH
jgi:hypothetical protein